MGLCLALCLFDTGPGRAALAQTTAPTFEPQAGPHQPPPDDHPEHAEHPEHSAPSGAPIVPADEPEPDAELENLLLGVDRLLSEARALADRELARKNYPEALRALERVHELAPTDGDVMIELGRLLSLLGNRQRAEGLYRAALALSPERGDLHQLLSELLADSDDEARLSEAAELLVAARERLGNRPEVILNQARVAARRGRLEEARRNYASYRSLAPTDDALRIELGDLHRDFGEPEAALDFYRQVEGSDQSGRLAAQRIFALEVERQARRYGLSGAPKRVSERTRKLLTRGRSASASGQHEAASSLLTQATELSPDHAPAHAALGDALSAAGKRDAAELSYLRALSLDPQAEVRVRLADLYLQAPGGGRAARAAALLSTTLSQRPDWTALHLSLARALRATGELPRALSHVQRFIAGQSEGPARAQALSLAAELQALIGTSEPGALAGPMIDDTAAGSVASTNHALSEARAHLSRGETDAALAALSRAEGPPSGELGLLRARILQAAGRLEDAERAAEQVIAVDRDSAEGHALLGTVRLASGQLASARRALSRAETLGDVGSALRLAELDAGEDPGLASVLKDAPRLIPLLHARNRLQGLRDDPEPTRRAQILALLSGVERRLTTLFLFAAAVVVLLAGFGLAVRRRIWGGDDLYALIDRAPEAGPELLRILSAVRHEVLKHNTMMLAGLSETLHGGGQAGEAASHIRKALLAPGGARERLEGYIEQLCGLGRTHGLRLNLRHQDAAIGTLLDGFAVLQSAEPLLARVDRLSRRGRRRLLARVGEAAELLNRQGYDALRALLDAVRTLAVDRDLLERICKRIEGEPALAARGVPIVELSPDACLPCSISMPQQAFEDILGNLLRNALQASQPRRSGGRVGLGVECALDPITGLPEARFLVLDCEGQRPSEAQLHSGYIEEGLGITADLAGRYDGSLEVSTEQAGWAKAVVLRVPGEASDGSTLKPQAASA